MNLRTERSGVSRFSATLGCLATILLLADPVAGQTTEEAPALQSIPAEKSLEFDQVLEELALQRSAIARLEQRTDDSEGFVKELFAARLHKVSTAMLTSTLNLAGEVADQAEAGADVTAYRDLVIEGLTALPDVAYAALQRIGAQVLLPRDEMSNVDLVVADQSLFKALQATDEIHGILISNIQIAPRFGLDISDQQSVLMEMLAESAENRSIFLELAIDDVTTWSASAATLPDNTDLADRLKAGQARVSLIAESLQKIVDPMAALDMNVWQYRQQILTATGEITTEVLDVNVATDLVTRWGQAAARSIAEDGPRLLFRLLLVGAILYGFLKLSQVVRTVADRTLTSSRVHLSKLLREMIVSTASNLVLILGILIGLSQLGVALGPLLAGLGIAGFIVGFAMQDALGNFASGILILFYRPFDIGDIVEVAGVEGTVSHLSLVNTTIMTFDNQTLVIPNNLVWGAVIKNKTSQKTRRVDLVFSISYDDDIAEAERVLAEILQSNEKILSEPEPIVRLQELGDSSLNFVVRPWVNTENYWEVLWDITRTVKLRFDEEGISIPFPRQDVQLVGQQAQ